MPPPTEPSRPAGRTGIVRAWLAWWVLCAALYLLLVDRTALAELVLGAGIAALAATAAVLVRGSRERLLRPRVRWLSGAWRPAVAVATDLRPLAAALWRRGILRREETGTLAEMPFAAVGDDGEQAAYRTLTAVLGSLGPNTVVVAIDRRRGVLLAHQLVDTGDVAASARPLSGPVPGGPA